MRQQRYGVESLGPVIREIEKRAKKLREIRPLVDRSERKHLDLRLRALEGSREILAKACKTAPKMNAYFAAVPEE